MRSRGAGSGGTGEPASANKSGKCPAAVTARANDVVTRLRAIDGNVLLFSSGHFIRVLAARWIGLEPSRHCNSFVLGTASVSAVGYDRDLSRTAIHLWNDTGHVSER